MVVTVTVKAWPAVMRFESEQDRTCEPTLPVTEQETPSVLPVRVPRAHVRPAGRGSLRTRPLAAPGPAFDTSIENEAASLALT